MEGIGKRTEASAYRVSILLAPARQNNCFLARCQASIQQRNQATMHDLVQALQATLSHEIPMTQHLNIQVARYDETGLVLQAPLGPNMNHKRTAFAGSLNAVVTLAGWGMLWLLLEELEIPAYVVIQDSTCSYLLPVTTDFSAHCPRPSQGQIDRMVEGLKKRGKARIELHTEIHNDKGVAVSFSGRYVLMVSEESGTPPQGVFPAKA